MDEIHVKVKGVWKYLYRAVDKAGATVDFLPMDRLLQIQRWQVGPPGARSPPSR